MKDNRTQRRRKPNRTRRKNDKRRCRFERAGIDYIDYKDVVTLQKLMTSQGKIFSRKRSGSTARWQRETKKAIKLARYMALLPYSGG